MDFNPTLIEAASWRLVSTIVRRHPYIAVTRTLFSGGLRDVLWLRSVEGLSLILNRTGRIHVLGRHDGATPTLQPVEWIDFLTAKEPMSFIESLEREAGLHPHPVASPTTASLVFSAIAGIVTAGVLAEPFEVTQGIFDTDGSVVWPNDDGSAQWWPEMLAVDPDLGDRGASHPVLRNDAGEALVGLDFWRIERDDYQLTFDVVSGSIWAELEEDPDDIDVAPGELYIENWIGTINEFVSPGGPVPPAESFSADGTDPTLGLLSRLLEAGLR